ncbi:putative membrane protein YiaA [Bacillus ectoiniformans]|uniref:hypothetical protein n=1 Tax=Bacillus ectoiniformans TaxID=1494429 RepID=UPI00195DA590|nr:hypothetical protein [Bacillus ectoiniformans]MBM7649074.1 putative membrane protein YiaA [Bacillus ectoiniformans]
MGKNKGYWITIIITLAINVVMLQWTIESYFGREFSHVYTYTGISLVSSIICAVTFFLWRKKEYQ